MGAAQVRILQTGGQTITRQTARALNEVLDTQLSPREWGRAVERLKREVNIPGDFHGKITSTGDYLDKAGNFLGNLFDYLK